MKALTVLLYGAGNASLSMIGRLFDVSRVSVYRWLRQEASSLEAPQGPEDVALREWKKTKFGSGKSMIHFQGEMSPGKWVHVLMEC